VSEPIKDTPVLLFHVFAGTLMALIASRPRATLRRLFGRKATAAVPEQRVRSTQTMAMLVALSIAAMLIIHFFFPSVDS
jgi:hypothetical protein